MLRLFGIGFVLFAAFFANAQTAKTQLIDGLMEQHGKPTAALLQLLALTDTPAVHHLDELIKETQARWYQQGKERWEFDDRFEARRAQLMPVLRQPNVVNEVQAQAKHYRYALLHGTIAPNMVQRIDFLNREWQRGVRFDEVIFVSGQRKLEPALEKTFIDAGLQIEPV